MKHLHIGIIALIALSFANTLARSESFNVDFDNGVDVHEFITTALQKESETCEPILVKLSTEIHKADLSNTLPFFQVRSQRPGAGYIYGPYPPYILNNAPYKEAQTYPPLLHEHESEMSYQLLNDWESIETIRSELLNEANVLDPNDKALYSEGVQLNATATALKDEKVKLQAEIDEFNGECAGQPSNDHCSSWYAALKAKIADYNVRLKANNEKISDWNKRKAELTNSVQSWISKINAWVGSIESFAADAKALLANHGNCTEKEWRPLYDAVKAACNVPRACEEGQDCGTLFKNLRQNQACYDARVKIKEICYTGVPDPGDHEQAIADALRAINNCRDLIKQQECEETIPASFPERRYEGM